MRYCPILIRVFVILFCGSTLSWQILINTDNRDAESDEKYGALTSHSYDESNSFSISNRIENTNEIRLLRDIVSYKKLFFQSSISWES